MSTHSTAGRIARVFFAALLGTFAGAGIGALIAFALWGLGAEILPAKTDPLDLFIWAMGTLAALGLVIAVVASVWLTRPARTPS